MDIKLIPLEKMILDGKEIRLGEKKLLISTSMTVLSTLSFWAATMEN